MKPDRRQFRRTSAGLVHGIRAVSSSAVRFTRVDEAFLSGHEVPPLDYVPWLPSTRPMSALNYVSNARGLATGLTFRPLATAAFAMLDE